jgi:hypothetical protein
MLFATRRAFSETPSLSSPSRERKGLFMDVGWRKRTIAQGYAHSATLVCLAGVEWRMNTGLEGVCG